MTGDEERGAPAGEMPPGHAGPQGEQDGGRKSADFQAYIGRQLRAVYDDVAKQPVPDRFVELMKRLESAGR